MKKIRLFSGIIILLFLKIVPIYAQSIVIKEDADSTLVIGTSIMYAKTLLNTSCGVSLLSIYNKNSDEEEMFIGVAIPTGSKKVYSQEFSKCIIKTFGGDIISATQIEPLSTATSTGSDMATWWNVANYHISLENLRKIFSSGINVIRIQASIGVIEVSYKTDVLGNYLIAEYSKIQTAKIANTSSLYEDF